MRKFVFPTNIFLPDFKTVDGTKWATVACDQYTSEKEYWESVENFVGGAPSTLRLMLPEAYLDCEGDRMASINSKMRRYVADGILREHQNTMIYLERTQSDGRVRRGLVAAIDLEDYDFCRGSKTLIRATEGTVVERIPPRVEIRRDALLEMPHIMMLIDDPENTVLSIASENAEKYDLAYSFPLMKNSGSVKGYFVDKADFDKINSALNALAFKGAPGEQQGKDNCPLLFAIGDGNHSLASAKTLYEEIKREIGEERAKDHPARYALCEIVNLHDSALEFEPIYRVLFSVNVDEFIEQFKTYLDGLSGSADEQSFELVSCDRVWNLSARRPVSQLAVGTLQTFLDEYLKNNPSVDIDYVHGIDSARKLAISSDTIGFLFDGMSKNMLFKTVIEDGALPRKTFSMGHADDKRFYIECRKIK